MQFCRVYKDASRCLPTRCDFLAFNCKIVKRNVFRPSPMKSSVPSQRGNDSLCDITTVDEFNFRRELENKNSSQIAPVTSFINGSPQGHVRLNDFVFGANPRLDILQRVVVWQRANARAGTACVKNRGEVRGGGRKPWPQKGLGKARQGSIRAPQWRGGGVVHGPKPKSYSYTLPKKVRRMGLRVALSCRFNQGDLFVVDSLDCDMLSNTEIFSIFRKNNWNSIVIVDSEPSERLRQAVQLFEKAELHNTISVNVYSILKHHKIVLSLDAIARLEERLYEDSRLIWK